MFGLVLLTLKVSPPKMKPTALILLLLGLILFSSLTEALPEDAVRQARRRERYKRHKHSPYSLPLKLLGATIVILGVCEYFGVFR